MPTPNDPACRSCHSTLVTPLVDFGPQPPSDLFPVRDDPGPDPSWPLILGQCRQCFLLQLLGDDAIVPEVPLAVESATSERHALESAQLIAADLSLRAGTTFTEFDSAHGGSWAPALKSLGLRQVHQGPVDLVVDVHGMIHESDLDASLARRASLLRRDGHLVVEFHHGLKLVKYQQFDTIRHGHPVYLSLTALRPAMARHGLHLHSARESDVYGGSLILTAGRQKRTDPSIARILSAERGAGLDHPERLMSLNDALWASADALHVWLSERAAAGRRVLGYGAPSKAPVLLNLARVDTDLLGFTVDLAPGKQNRRMPATGIPIRAPQDLVAAVPDDVLIFTWDIADEVRANLRALGIGEVEYYTPLPTPTRLH